MKVLFFIHAMTAGGAERQASLLCNHWARSGREVVLATLRDDLSHYDLHPAIARRSIRTDGSSSSLKNQWSDLRSMRRLIAQERPDVVTSFMDAINIKVLFAAKKSGIPVVISERSVPESSFMYGRLLGTAVATLRRLVYPLSAALVVQTEPVARWARQKRLSRKIAVIPNVVDSEGELVDETTRQESDLILSIGRLSPEKGHDILIRAFGCIGDLFPAWRLKIIGDGVSREQLAALIRSLGLQGRAELVPTQKSVAQEYRGAGVFVLPSRFEGFPNTLLEAMLAGCPVVAANCPVGPGEIISDGVDGLLFRNEDVSDLASKLTTIISNAGLRARLGGRARETVKKYRSEIILPQWDKLLDAAAARRQPPGHCVSPSSQVVL